MICKSFGLQLALEQLGAWKLQGWPALQQRPGLAAAYFDLSLFSSERHIRTMFIFTFTISFGERVSRSSAQINIITIVKYPFDACDLWQPCFEKCKAFQLCPPPRYQALEFPQVLTVLVWWSCQAGLVFQAWFYLAGEEEGSAAAAGTAECESKTVQRGFRPFLR